MRDALRASTIKASSRLLRLGGVVGWLERATRDAAAVLVYHKVPAALLESHLDSVASASRIVSLDELVRRCAEGRSVAGLVAVTFDDGYRQTTLEAAELAERRGWPMTFFVPSGAVSRTRSYWFVEISSLCSHASGQVHVEGLTLKLGSRRGSRAARELVRRLLARSPEEIDAVLAELRGQLGVNGSGLPHEWLPVSWDDVERLARLDAVTFGAHTITHAFLGSLSEEEIERELTESARALAERVGAPVRHFAYPYGSPESIGTAAPRVARRLFASASTMTRGRCRPGVDLHLLPRVPVYDVDDEQMLRLKLATARPLGAGHARS